jgi:hypothetical protein
MRNIDTAQPTLGSHCEAAAVITRTWLRPFHSPHRTKHRAPSLSGSGAASVENIALRDVPPIDAKNCGSQVFSAEQELPLFRFPLHHISLPHIQMGVFTPLLCLLFCGAGISPLAPRFLIASLSPPLSTSIPVFTLHPSRSHSPSLSFMRSNSCSRDGLSLSLSLMRGN